MHIRSRPLEPPVEQAAEHYSEKRSIEAEERRGAWLEDRFIEIDAAETVGALKKIVEDAIAITRSQNDPDAEQQILAARDAKVAKAKRNKTEGATA